jgi:hypothetical protein
MKKALAVFGMVVAIAPLTSAGPTLAQQRVQFGDGTKSCSQWTQARQIADENIVLMAQWIAGFLSGLNAESADTDFLTGTDFDDMVAWVDKHCREQPLDVLGTAALKLRAELQSTAAR